MTDLPQPTALGAVTDKLVAAFAALSDVLVLDGPTPEPPKRDTLIVGGSAGTESASGDHHYDGRLGFGPINESYDIVCALWSWSGSKGMKPRRDRCVAILSQIRQILLDDPTLGDTCSLARLGERYSWYQQATSAGWACSVGFTIHYAATI